VSRRSRQLTYYAPDAGEAPEPVLEPRTDGLWGYSLADIDRLSYYAVRGHLQWWTAGDRADQKTAAWEGITDYLLTAWERPTENDLLSSGQHGIGAYVRGERRHHGAPHNHDATGEKFGIYWAWAVRVSPSPEGGITDRLAVPAILATLPPRQGEVIDALAAYGDYETAAKAVGISYKTFHANLTLARRRFLALWFEGETPPEGTWRQDKRASMERLADEVMCGTQSGYNRHLKRKEQPCRACHETNLAVGRANYAKRKARAAAAAGEAA
jgi:hypothetical protein